MKKTYVKPVFHMEHFSLAQSVADGCGAAHWDEVIGGPTHGTKYMCGWDDGFGDVYWLDNVSGCTTKVDETFELEGVCYNNPDGSKAIFNS